MNTAGAMLVTQIRVKPNNNKEFALWLEQMSSAVEQASDYISETITRPHPPVQRDWVIVDHFASTDAAKNWLQAQRRKILFEQVLPMLEGGIDNVYLLEDTTHTKSAVTATISTFIRPEDEAKFLAWNALIAPVESKFPGFLGHRLERPRPGVTKAWITVVTFDSDEHLEAWLESPERKKLVDELDTFNIERHETKSYTGFDFWFNANQDNKHSAWKENMLVLLTLYPVVFLLSYIQNPLMAHGVPFWLALFFGNAASTSILGWITVPWLMKHFAWWINPPLGVEQRYSLQGACLVVALYALSMGICWLLSTI